MSLTQFRLLLSNAPRPIPSHTGGIRGEGRTSADNRPENGWVWTKLVRFRTISESAQQRNFRFSAALSAIAKSAPQSPVPVGGKACFCLQDWWKGGGNPTSPSPPFAPRAYAPPNSSGLESNSVLNFLKLP